MEDIKYFFGKKKQTQDLVEDFERLTSWLSHGIAKLNKISDDIYSLSYENISYKSMLELKKLDGKEGKIADSIVLTCSRNDINSIKHFRIAANNLGYKVFSMELGVCLPEDLNLRDLGTTILDPETSDVIKKRGFDPLFMYSTGSEFVIYAKGLKGEVHIINPYLVVFYLLYSDDNSKLEEFNYQVAADMEEFAAFWDKGLIPRKFYEYYKKDLRIMNESHFDIEKTDRKIFVKPFIFGIKDTDEKMFLLSTNKGSAFTMDKIRPGETLEMTLKRILQDLGISNDFIRARVDRDIEFDRDKEGVVTPRLVVFVFVEKILKMPAGVDKGWT